MAPKSAENLCEQSSDLNTKKEDLPIISSTEKPFKAQIVWRNVLAFIFIHFCGIRIFYFWDWRLFWFHFFYGFLAAFGVVSGAHRLWAHKSYKANKKLQWLLMIMQTICVENDIIEWARDHRVHHKFSDTDADPSNSKRGFFFSHMGWLMVKKHPDVRRIGGKIDMSDLESDPLLQFQRKYYIPLVLFWSFAFPMVSSIYIFNMPAWRAFYAVMCRYMISLHIVWLTNSVAHRGDWKPYDKNICASDSKFYGTLCFGEGWHNFHHVFPFDYKLMEHTKYSQNWGAAFIDFFAWLGWATDLKVASDDMIRKRVLRTGDGSHPYSIEEAKKKGQDWSNNNNNNGQQTKGDVLWGLGDEDLPSDEIQGIETTCKKEN